MPSSDASGKIKAVQVEKEAQPGSDVVMKETSMKLLLEKCLSAAAVAKQLDIYVHTAQKWAKQYEKNPDSIFEKRRKTGHPRVLHDGHKSIILECIEENPSIALDELIEKTLQLVSQKSSVSTHRSDNKEKIQERLDWIRKWEKANIDFTRNCVFLDESAFHINLKHGMAWSRKGTPAVVTVPKTRATTTTILGVMSAEGLIKRSRRLPQPPSDKKRK
ncbi:hypothetical protein RMCBS344292_09630 [Rhizopus microsporus]|nr:hypothetical protein RMCBS344292_09630 [Rhizopus microsporus]